MNIQKGPLVFGILDGWGIGNRDKRTNAIHAAKTPFFDFAWDNFPKTALGATGVDVGLEEGQMSGSEAGHMNIGAGRVVIQDVRLILEAIDNGSFFHNPVFLEAIDHAKRFSSNIHLIGLLGNSDSPHAHPDIVLALLILLRNHELEGRVFLHLFTDGRDSFPQSALELWEKWKKAIESSGVARLATVSGRFFGMDRSKNWGRLIKSYNAMVHGKGDKVRSFEQAISENYKKGKTDEYIEPAVLVENGKPLTKIKNKDSVIFFNFRSDRARQFSKLFVGKKTKRETGFPKHKFLQGIFVVAMTNFGPDLDLKTAFVSNPVIGALPTSLIGKKQLYISETEKFAHVTYFINGGYAKAVAGEERIMIDSPEVKSYAERPEMSCRKITEAIISNLGRDGHDFITVNYPNADMLGHTGDFSATVKGVEAVDSCLASIFRKLKKINGTLVLTADHGNAETMLDKKTKRVFTFHTKNPVPFIVIFQEANVRNLRLHEGVLGNIAPTLLDILALSKPNEMRKESLIK